MTILVPIRFPLSDHSRRILERALEITEEAILDEAVSQTIDHLIIGRNGRSKWRLFIRRVLDIGVDLETALTEELDIQLEVVD